MTREEKISMWAAVAEAVFWAEELICKEWDERLRNAPSLSKKERHELARAYCRAIAEEIVSDEENNQKLD